MKAPVFFLAVLLLLCAPLSSCGTATVRPNPELARPIGWPSAQDLERLESVKGLRPAEVIQKLGHPIQVTTDENQGEQWIYPWLAAAAVYFRDGVVVWTFYTAGY